MDSKIFPNGIAKLYSNGITRVNLILDSGMILGVDNPKFYIKEDALMMELECPKMRYL